MSGRKVLSVPVVLVLLLAGLSLMVAGSYGTGPAPAWAHRPDRTQGPSPTQGGPDPYGYTYTDSAEPGGAAFDWLDASGGTALNIGDNETAYVPLPFSFTFYGKHYSDLAIYNEGALFLGMPPLELPEMNEPLGTTLLANLIAPFWDNLAAGSGLVYYGTLGTFPGRRFVVEWHDRLHDSFVDASATVTFEVILYEGTNNIKFQYQDTDFGDGSLDEGASATAGIRESDSNYLQYSYNQAVLESGMAICFQYPGSPPCDLPPRIEVLPTYISTSQLAGEVTTRTLSISNSGDLDLDFSLAEIPPAASGTAGPSTHAVGVPSVHIPARSRPSREVPATTAISSIPIPDSQARGRVDLGTAAAIDMGLPWVGAAPASGTVPGGGSLQVTVTFTAPLEVHDTYTATLRLSSNDPLSPQVDLPLTMSVVLPPRLSIAKRPAGERIGVPSLLTYTLSVSNTGGPVSNVTISDTLPSETGLAWASDGGTPIGSRVVWSDLQLPTDAQLVLSFAITVGCVPSSTEIVNRDYQAKASDWPPPVVGQAVTVTTIAEDAVARFDTPPLLLRQEPVPFTNLSHNSSSFLWHFGDGFSSSLDSPVHTYMQRGTYTAVLTASNRCSADEYSRELSVEDLALAVAPTLANGQAVLGQTAIYTLALTNTGTLGDSFALSLAGQQWSTALSTGTIGPLAPGSAEHFRVVVSVPHDAVPGELDQVTVQAVSSTDPREPPASATTLLSTSALAYWRYLPLVFR